MDWMAKLRYMAKQYSAGAVSRRAFGGIRGHISQQELYRIAFRAGERAHGIA